MRNLIDTGIGVFDTAMKTLFKVNQAERLYPASHLSEPTLTTEEIKQSASYMRVNHAGEIAAQALYQGQQITARSEQVKHAMQEAALEEIDHLVWCEERLKELASHTSYLAPVWFFGAFMIGMTAGLAGDQWSLGFLAETEKQVVAHLEGHLHLIPKPDLKSIEVINKMREDEEKHANTAIHTGATSLPKPIRHLMRLTARVMTTVAYRF
ncbi:MAG: 2-polyprenyl-3-methyl-6-methoxy-1,4-benzoquinone monooxygenase [Legionellales bacterium]|nr:2-polyprenyl-3-methyl-6-methoxy-1,4-benzoquinone monooxygenase [Legionellales bacterium]